MGRRRITGWMAVSLALSALESSYLRESPPLPRHWIANNNFDIVLISLTISASLPIALILYLILGKCYDEQRANLPNYKRVVIVIIVGCILTQLDLLYRIAGDAIALRSYVQIIAGIIVAVISDLLFVECSKPRESSLKYRDLVKGHVFFSRVFWYGIALSLDSAVVAAVKIWL